MPPMVRDRFSRFEQHIERLVEGSFARLFAGHLHPREIAVQLARAMEDHAQTDEGGQPVAPHSYTVALHPTDHEAIFSQQPDFADRLAEELVDMARAAGMRMVNVPDVQVVPDQRVAQRRASVQANPADEPHDATQALEPVQLAEKNPAAALGAALVSGEDRRVIPLDREVVNVGRSRENHVILNDQRVSRRHAQLRLRFGRYTLYDLDSQSGTLVNGQPVQEWVLQPGDVMSLGGVNLIYTEDTDDLSGLGDTEAHPPVDSSS